MRGVSVGYIVDFNPLRPRGRRRKRIQKRRRCLMWISTHSAREDGDAWSLPYSLSVNDFNPLRPRGRRRLILCFPMYFRPFQPTPPARTETAADVGKLAFRGDFNPLRPRGRRPNFQMEMTQIYDFNPLRPRGRRRNTQQVIYPISVFQPTPPARTETSFFLINFLTKKISTHSAREDGDLSILLV